jgi:hypothetical protein
MNGLKVNYKLGREVAAAMSVVFFVVPVLNPKTRVRDMRKMWEQTICDGDNFFGISTALKY